MTNPKNPRIILILILLAVDLLGTLCIIVTGDSLQVSRVSAIAEIIGLLALAFAGYELSLQQRKPNIKIHFSFPDVKNFYTTKWEGGPESYQGMGDAWLKREKPGDDTSRPLGFSSQYACKIFVENSGSIAGTGIRANLSIRYSIGRKLNYKILGLEWEPELTFETPENWVKLPGESYQMVTVYSFNDIKRINLYLSTPSVEGGIVKQGLESFVAFYLKFDFSLQDRREPLYLTSTIEGINFSEVQKTVKIFPQDIRDEDFLLF